MSIKTPRYTWFMEVPSTSIYEDSNGQEKVQIVDAEGSRKLIDTLAGRFSTRHTQDGFSEPAETIRFDEKEKVRQAMEKLWTAYCEEFAKLGSSHFIEYDLEEGEIGMTQVPIIRRIPSTVYDYLELIFLPAPEGTNPTQVKEAV